MTPIPPIYSVFSLVIQEERNRSAGQTDSLVESVTLLDAENNKKS